jgi:hypothetical protein
MHKIIKLHYQIHIIKWILQYIVELIDINLSLR